MENKILGVFQEFNYPAGAEQHCISISLIRTMVPSKIIPGAMMQGPDEFYCPRCRKKSEFEQKHGMAVQCGKCGLNWQTYGMGLFIWESE